MQSQLPPELLENILFYLRTSSDLSSLRTCAAVNHFFCSLAEPHLYHHLELTNVTRDPEKHTYVYCDFNSEQILKLLTDRPHIATYVRSLTIRIGTGRGVNSPRTSLGDESIGPVLQLLKNLETILLFALGRTFWKKLSSKFRSAFASALALPTMRNLDIRAVEEFPLEVIGASTSLEKLSLLGSFSLGAQGPLNPAHRRAVLKSLTLQYCTASLPRINAWSNSQAGHEISQLTHFRATVWREADYEQLPSILSACAGSLKVLELDPGIEVNLRNVASAPDSGLQPEARPLFSSATFSLRTTLSTLKHLQLHLAVEAYQGTIMNASRQLVSSWFTPFEWVGQLLEELRPPRTRHPIASSSPSNLIPSTPSLALEQLTLNISFRVDPNSTIFCEASWAPLATSLSSFSEAVPSLRRVLICATGGENHPLFDRDENGRKKIVETLERDVALAPLVAKGLLKVTSVDDEE